MKKIISLDFTGVKSKSASKHLPLRSGPRKIGKTDATQIGDFLNLLPLPPGYFRPLTILVEGRPPNTVFQKGRVWVATENFKRNHNAYYGLNLTSQGSTKKRKLSKSDIVGLVGLQLDYDCLTQGYGSVLQPEKDEVLRALKSCPSPPSLIIDTGNGLQGVWLLETPILGPTADEIAAVERCNKLLGEAFGGDSVFDVCRLLRVPGTRNYPTKAKQKKQRRLCSSQLVHSSHARYSLDDFEDPFVGLNRIQVSEDIKLKILGGSATSGDDRSTTACSVASAMAAGGHSKTEIESVLTNQNFGVSERYFDREKYKTKAKALSWVRETIDSAITKFGTDAVSNLEWPELIPISHALPDVPRFEPGILPKVLRDWTEDASGRMNAPIEYFVTSLIAALGSVIGRQLSIRPKKYDKWAIYPNLWALNVGRPSKMKSPPLKEVMRFVDALQHSATKEFRGEYEIWEDVVQNEGADQAGPPPVERRFYTGDSTYEKLAELLQSNPNGLLAVNDEMGGFLASLKMSGREPTRSFYNQAFDGDGTFTMDRIGRGSTIVRTMCVTVLGNVQPGILNEVISGAFDGAKEDDGFLQRFLMSVLPDGPSEIEWIDRAPNRRAHTHVSRTFERLSTIDFSVFSAMNENGNRYVNLTEEARNLFVAKFLDLKRRAAEHPLPAIESLLIKHIKLVAGYALIHHCVEFPQGGPIQADSMRAAIKISEFFEAHATRIFDCVVNHPTYSARLLLEKIEDKSLPAEFSARQVYRNHWSGLDRRSVDLALQVLEERGYVRSRKKETGGRAQITYQIRPDLL
ncbi:MAG: DUF3987 domain-containing protein [Pseudomonadota bacterium]